MKRITTKLFLVGTICVSTAALSGCGDSASSSAQGQQPGTSGATLYDKYGGAPFVAKVISDGTAAILADCTQNPYFTTVLGTPGHDTQDQLASCLMLQLTAAMGGPATYPGKSTLGQNVPAGGFDCRDMQTVHNGLGIPGNVFDQFVTDLGGVFKANGMSDEDILTLAPKLAALKPQIVAPAGQEATFNYTPTNPPGNGCQK